MNVKLNIQSCKGDILFEVFSPVDETRQVLPMPNNVALGAGVSLVSELNQTFYFIVADCLVV